ncbi:MAG: 2'-5' RNA ligase family protein [Planctomycetota bacterium]|nr:2'-5' RNA ligase family protein [Planctomycetota bacterium]
MPFVLELLLDESAAARVRTIWEDLAAAGLPHHGLELETAPHVTIAVFEDLDPIEARSAFASFAAEETPEPITLYNPAAFPTAEGVLFLAPVVTRGLLELHAGFHERFAALDQPVGEYFFPGNWVPHVTMGLGLDSEQLARGLAVLMAADLPIHGHLDRLELLEFQLGEDGRPAMPLELHHRLRLGQ